jgi:hypothetical protein
MGEMQYGLLMKQRQWNVDRLGTWPGMHEFQGLRCARDIVRQDRRTVEAPSGVEPPITALQAVPFAA